jgi:putative aldouronate transport system permease protein
MNNNSRLFSTIANIVLMIWSIICILPFLLLVSSSFSSEKSILVSGYSFIPREFSMEAYNYLASNFEYIMRAYGITFLITILGTAVSLLITTMLAYPLSRDDMPFRKAMTFYVFFTMLFNGGLVPTYLLYNNVFHIKNTIFALVIPYLLLSAFNVLIARTFFVTNIPMAIIESAKIDGAGEFLTFSKIVMPLSLPILATLGLFVGVGYWNDWFNGMVFLTDPNLYSIQNLLNQMLQNIQFMQNNPDIGSRTTVPLPETTVKMAIAVIGVFPILFVYPFFQKYFVKGIVIGAVKG